MLVVGILLNDNYSFCLFVFQDSFLLGKIHVALLKVLLSDVKKELDSGCFSHLSVSCKFLALLHSVSMSLNQANRSNVTLLQSSTGEPYLM